MTCSISLRSPCKQHGVFRMRHKLENNWIIGLKEYHHMQHDIWHCSSNALLHDLSAGHVQHVCTMAMHHGMDDWLATGKLVLFEQVELYCMEPMYRQLVACSLPDCCKFPLIKHYIMRHNPAHLFFNNVLEQYLDAFHGMLFMHGTLLQLDPHMRAAAHDLGITAIDIGHDGMILTNPWHLQALLLAMPDLLNHAISWNLHDIYKQNMQAMHMTTAMFEPDPWQRHIKNLQTGSDSSHDSSGGRHAHLSDI